MTPELASLVWISTFTALLGVPYLLSRIVVGGIAATVGYPSEPPSLSSWAQRLRAAHANAVEKLVVFAALILAVLGLGIGTPTTARAATLYLWSRVTHAVPYTLGVPWLRTTAFVGGFAAQMILAAHLVTQ